MTAADRRALVGIVALFSVGYSLFGLFRHWHFASSYDLAIFDQAVWHLSRLEPPASSISGFANILGDHFYPIIAVFAPLYWIASGPETLIVAQAILFTASIVPVYLFLQSRVPRGPARMLAIAFALFWGMQRAVGADVHEIAFAPLAIATAVLAMDRRRWPLFWLALGVIVLIKEDLIPLIGGFGVYLWLQGERRRALWLIGAGIVAFALVIGVVIPAFSDVGQSPYSAQYGKYLREPLTIFGAVFTPTAKIETVVLWFGPFLFLPLASPLAILAIPIALTRLLSDIPNHWAAGGHYSAPLAPIIAMSAGDGLQRVIRGLKLTPAAAARFMNVAAGIALVACALVPGHQPLLRVLAPRHYRSTLPAQTSKEALTMIPPTASVIAQAAILPHLSHRQDIFVLMNRPAEAEYVIANANLSAWPEASFADLQAILDDKKKRGYAVLFDRDGWTVLRRIGDR